ncbi:MAG: multiheme c-type cytochrome, partial [Candidatus Binatia bacterium]
MASAVIVAALAIATWFLFLRNAAPPAQPPAVTTAPIQPEITAVKYVGAQTCASCHQVEHKRWSDSQHAKAMQQASAATVLGNFNNAKFAYSGVTSTFFRRGDKFMVRTDGADGKLTDFEVEYTFGIEPLQQYLIEFPGGRLQALSIAWDTRPKEQGGQRWFHLYAGQNIKADDPLH